MGYKMRSKPAIHKEENNEFDPDIYFYFLNYNLDLSFQRNATFPVGKRGKEGGWGAE